MSLEDWGGLDDIDASSGVSESTKEGAERAAEASRRRAQAIKALQKQEGKVRKQEASLIHILVQFIQSGQHRDVTNIIIKLLEQNIPVQIILGILSLVFTELQAIVRGEIVPTAETKLHLNAPTQDDITTALASAADVKEFHAEQLPADARRDLTQWIKDIIQISLPAKNIILARAFPNQHVNSTLVRLMVVILERYIANHHIRGHHERMSDFAAFALQGVMKQLIKAQPEQLESTTRNGGS